MTRYQLVSFFFLGLLLYVFYTLAHVFSPFFEAIFWAAVFSFAFRPLYLKFTSRGLQPPFAAFFTVTIIFLTIAPVVTLIIVRLAEEALHSYDFFLEFAASGRLNHRIEEIRRWSVVERLRSHAALWDFIKDHSQNWMLKGGKYLANFTAAQTAAFTKNIMLLALNSVLTLFLCFFFLKDGNNIYRFIYQITPLEDEDKAEIFHRMIETFQAVIQGQIFTAFVQAGLAGFIFACLGLPLPILFAGLTFLFSMVPVTGAATIWFPFAVYLLMAGHVTKAIILLFLGFFGISLIDNFLKPILIGEKTKLPYMVLFLGILGGLRVYGLMGVFLVPTLLSLLLVLIKITRERFSVH